MSSAFDYRELASEYVSAAEATDDPVRKSVLLGIARLYHETALTLEWARSSPQQFFS